jgi:hypothetical protein
MIKTTGVEWKAFHDDESFWKEGYMLDDEVITVDGSAFDPYADITTIPDAAQVTVDGGYVYDQDADKDLGSLESFFKKWRKLQVNVYLTVEVPKDRLDVVLDAIKTAGAKAIK